MLKEMLERISKEYNYTNTSSDVFQLITDQGPNAIRTLGHISNDYKIYGKHGQGNTARVPWIVICDRSVTTSAQKGYYIVYLFNAENKGVYLCLNQGWTDYENKYGIQRGRIEIKKTAINCRNLINSSLSTFNTFDIDSGADSTLARGYELGHICGKFYPSNNIPPDNILINDLRNLMGIYSDLKGLLLNHNTPITGATNIVKKIKEESELIEDAEYQKEVEKAAAVLIPNSPQPKPVFSSRGNVKSWTKNPGIARQVLEGKNYQCEVNNSHITFTSEVTGRNYVECHHLIPMKIQDSFQNSLDVPANIIALCPNCHRLFHHAKNDEKANLIEKFHQERENKLRNFGICITISDLIRYYA